MFAFKYDILYYKWYEVDKTSEGVIFCSPELICACTGHVHALVMCM